MMKRFLKFRYGEKGFTLIELLIVIAILGVLAAVIIPNVQRFTQSGMKAAALQEMQTIQTAVDAAMAESGSAALAAPLVVGPSGATGDPWEIVKPGPVNTGVNVGDFLRRDIEGQWTVDDVDGLIKSGVFKFGETNYWEYTKDGSPEWVWATAP